MFFCAVFSSLVCCLGFLKFSCYHCYIPIIIILPLLCSNCHVSICMLLLLLQDIGTHLSVKFYAPDLPSFDMNLVCIWLTAVFTIVLGSFWSGTVRYQL